MSRCDTCTEELRVKSTSIERTATNGKYFYHVAMYVLDATPTGSTLQDKLEGPNNTEFSWNFPANATQEQDDTHVNSRW